ncbi:MAG: MaoC/PaaZ C-terminal domain-containing protein [Candidatus Binatia bacterium]
MEAYFEGVNVGDALPSRSFGPLTIVDTVRWAGIQENWARLHFDREHVREQSGLKTFIASGAYRQALLIRAITDWIGPRGWLQKLSVRHTAPTFEGDMMIYSGKVVEKSSTSGDPWIMCELEGKNQEGKQIVTGRCTVILPAKKSGVQGSKV